MAYCRALAYCSGVASAPLTVTIGDSPNQSAPTSVATTSMRVTGLPLFLSFSGTVRAPVLAELLIAAVVAGIGALLGYRRGNRRAGEARQVDVMRRHERRRGPGSRKAGVRMRPHRMRACARLRRRDRPVRPRWARSRLPRPRAGRCTSRKDG